MARRDGGHLARSPLAGQRRGRPQRTAVDAGTWCHGEAGIALTRMRAVALSGAEAERHDAELALGTTRRHVRGLLAGGIEDLSLCHGAAGSADVLLSADGRAPEAVALGEPSLERYHEGADRGRAAFRAERRPACSWDSAASAGGSCGSMTQEIPSPLGKWG